MENKFNEGDRVYALTDPSQELIVRRYVQRIYYCSVANYPDRPDLVYFERELELVKPIK